MSTTLVQGELRVHRADLIRVLPCVKEYARVAGEPKAKKINLRFRIVGAFIVFGGIYYGFMVDGLIGILVVTLGIVIIAVGDSFLQSFMEKRDDARRVNRD